MGISLTGNLGWHYGYRLISLIQIALTGILLFSLPMWKSNHDQIEDKSNSALPLTFKQLMGFPGARQTLIAFFCYCSLEQVTGLWGSSYMVLEKGITKEAAASFISLFYLGITAGRFFSGLLTLKLNTKNIIRVGQGLIIVGIALIFLSITPTALLAGLILTGLGCAPIYPGLLYQTPERFGKKASQSMMGLQMACAYLGSTFSPPLIGLLTEKISITIYPVFQFVFTGAMILLVEYCNRQSHSGRRTVNE
jgi:fucose permease